MLAFVFLSSCQQTLLWKGSHLQQYLPQALFSGGRSKRELTLSGNTPTRSICVLSLLGQVGGNGMPVLSTKANKRVWDGDAVLLPGI